MRSEITPDTAIKLTIARFIVIISFVIGLGFSAGGLYIKLTLLANDVTDIQKRIKRIEQKIDIQYGENKNSRWNGNKNSSL